MTYTISFGTKSEAIDWFSMMGMQMVRKLPTSYVGTSFGDKGEKIDMVAISCGINKFDITEKAR